MNRTDSAFDDTFCLPASKDEATILNKSNTTSTRHRKSKRTPPNLSSCYQSPNMEERRSALEKRSRKSTDHNGKSMTSTSSEHSTTKSRRRHRNSNSLPSSRRTSCTIIDPSRPARHYRIKSSQTCPTTNRDIDDVLALHFRSCNLFQNPTHHSAGAPSPTISGHGIELDTDFGSMQERPGTTPHTRNSVEGIGPTSPKADEEAVTKSEAPDTIMHWMSPGTRRTQYDKIDRANSGFRGLFKRAMPRCVSGPPPPKFYENDKSDAGSVRRYRMDVDDDEHEDEKSTSALRMQHRKLHRSTTHAMNTKTKTKTKTKRWWCF